MNGASVVRPGDCDRNDVVGQEQKLLQEILRRLNLNQVRLKIYF